MIFIFGRYNQKVEETATKNLYYLRVRHWFSFFFIPVIPVSNKHIYADLKKKIKYSVTVPILSIALLLNMFFYAGLLVTYGFLRWLLCLGAWIAIILLLSNNPTYTMYASIILFLVACYFTFKECKKRQALLEKYQATFKVKK
jgi:hypothetical protein